MMKEILKYIQLYTGCSEHALKRIEVILEPKLQPVIVETIEKKPFRELPSKIPIKIWAEDYCNDFNIQMTTLMTRSRKQEIVDIRYEFIKSAYVSGYKCTTIARFLKRDHSTILHAINK